MGGGDLLQSNHLVLDSYVCNCQIAPPIYEGPANWNPKLDTILSKAPNLNLSDWSCRHAMARACVSRPGKEISVFMPTFVRSTYSFGNSPPTLIGVGH